MSKGSGSQAVHLPGEGGLLQDCMSGWPSAEACVTVWNPGQEPEFESLSFEAFQQLSGRAAGWMADTGVEVGDTVILLIRHPALLMVVFWGAVLRGAVPTILAYPNFKIDREKYAFGLAGVTGKTKARLVIVDSEFPSDFKDLITLPGGTSLQPISRSEIEEAAFFDSDPAVNPDHPVLLQHSAGTTGLQKGVVLSHRRVLRQLGKLARHLELDRTDRIVSWLPLYHDMGLIACFLLPLASGLPVVMQSPDDWVLRPLSFLQIVTRFRATRSWLPNFAFAFLSRRVKPSQRIGLDLSSLRSIINCSEPVTSAAMDLFYETFKDHGLSASAMETSYAMAENVFAVTHSARGRPAARVAVDGSRLNPGCRIGRAGDSGSRPLTLVSSGTCLQDTELRIRFHDRQLAEAEVGDIWIRSDCLFDSYVQSTDSERVFEGDWFKSGDVGFLRGGELYVLGRADDFMIIGGRNVYPTDIEEVVSLHPSIQEGRVVAFGITSRKSGTQDLVVIAELNKNGELVKALDAEGAVRERIVADLGIAPRVVRVVKPGWIVKSSAGKPARQATRARFLDANADLGEQYGWTTGPWNA